MNWFGKGCKYQKNKYYAQSKCVIDTDDYDTVNSFCTNINNNLDCRCNCTEKLCPLEEKSNA